MGGGGWSAAGGLRSLTSSPGAIQRSALFEVMRYDSRVSSGTFPSSAVRTACSREKVALHFTRRRHFLPHLSRLIYISAGRVFVVSPS